MSGKHWTKEQKQFLIENVGILSYDAIAKKVGKTPRATRQKKVRMELGDPKENSDYITIKYLSKIIHSSAKTINKWIKNNGLKATHRIVAHKQLISRINIADFWKWAKKNPKKINWNKFEYMNLGAEPDWTKEARKKYKKVRSTWTTEKENLLESYYKIGLSCKQISENMRMTQGAIRARHNLIIKRKSNMC
jgi:hypothetical protein